jgi:hypothetical protein
MGGVISLAEGPDAPLHLQSSGHFCRQLPYNKVGVATSLRKLSLSESAALKLHPELEQKIKDGTIPTPFHPGAQWAGESSAGPATDAGATTASAAPTPEQGEAVDPLVGLWWEASPAASDCNYKWCFLSIGQDQSGKLKGVSWVPEWANYGGHPAPVPNSDSDTPWPIGTDQVMSEVRSVSFVPDADKAYNWAIDREVHKLVNLSRFCYTKRGAKSGRLTVTIGDKETTLSSDKALCGGFWATGNIVFHRITANGAAVLDLPEWYKQQVEAGTMPSPFVGMDQWSKAPASAKAKVEKIPQSTDNEPQEFKETGR